MKPHYSGCFGKQIKELFPVPRVVKPNARNVHAGYPDRTVE